MEVLAAFSLSGTILEFARFGMELLSDGRELYKSSQGALSANEQLELATSDLRALLVKLRSRHRPPVIAQDEKDEETFQRILHRAEETAKELVERLERLKVKGPKSRKWESVRKAVQSVWTKDEVEALTKKLERFKDAMDTLIQLVRRTDTVNTNEHHQTRARISNEQVGDGRAQLGGLKEITARFEMLDVSDAEETRLRRKVQADILKSLSYSAMTERYEDIVEAFPETFEWAFKDSTTEQFKWSNLSEWLKEGSGVYWISGKAGSGKSILMKHIFDDIRTRQYLRVWATGNAHESQSRQQIPLCLATFFFWNSGTPEQKSQSGLLRALLYQVLSDWPELISVVFPHMWAKWYSDSIETGLSLSFDQALTVRRLTSAFRKLSQQTMVPLKLCFLVDGLDEFYGDHEELATLFKLATASPMVKVCLSSRPWVIFEQIYGARPSMRLQDLTYLDIYHYVSSNFNHNPAFGRLEVSDPGAAVLLRNEVIEKADGVFLWVDLVVKSLLTGIRNQDDITILRQRLMTMPQKLEDLYRHLLGLIEPVYLSWASKAFQIVRAARELCTDGLAGLKRTEGTESLHAKYAAVKTHLTARCAGLLEVNQFKQKGPKAPIQFLHQTARDFLQQDDVWSEILGHAKCMGFNPHKAMLKASVMDLAIKSTEKSVGYKEIYGTVKSAMLLCIQYQCSSDTKRDRDLGP
ncbi:hypothetical protein NA56DRAFT_574848 [Hyaloscypha hepaticicola]|uniref:Uncharacterized protein n=1 Tax=Hyaloscypha hepaticicola TaxID=2082293 RepID=A0A2J6Q0Y7_9HELO|nr:hypothetical protein NA56DRAFT_574848 [Hyaloscypha hepaticicola]